MDEIKLLANKYGLTVKLLLDANPGITNINDFRIPILVNTTPETALNAIKYDDGTDGEVYVTAPRVDNTSLIDTYLKHPIENAMTEFIERDPLFGKRRVLGALLHPDAIEANRRGGDIAGTIFSTIPALALGTGEAIYGLTTNTLPTLIAMASSYAAGKGGDALIRKYTPYAGYGDAIYGLTDGGIPRFVADTYNPITWGTAYATGRAAKNLGAFTNNVGAVEYNATKLPVMWNASSNAELVSPGLTVVMKAPSGSVTYTYSGAYAPNNNAGMVRGGRYYVRPGVMSGATTSRGLAASASYTLGTAPMEDYPNINIFPNIPVFSRKVPMVSFGPLQFEGMDLANRLEQEVPKNGWDWYLWYAKLPENTVQYFDGRPYIILRTKPDITVRLVAPIEEETATSYIGHVVPDSTTYRTGSPVIVNPRLVEGAVLGNPVLDPNETITVLK